jgi:heme exporter protein B
MNRVAYLIRPSNFRLFKIIFKRHIILTFKNINEIMHPLIYFIIATIFFKVAMGNIKLPSMVLVGIVYTLNTFALILTNELLLVKDYKLGFLEQFYLIGNNFFLILLSKYLGHLVVYSLALLIALPIVLFLLDIEISLWLTIVFSIFLLNAEIILLLMFSSCLLLGAKSHVLLSLIVLILMLPAVIFAILSISNPSYLNLLLALLLFLGPLIFFLSRYLIEVAFEDS